MKCVCSHFLVLTLLAALAREWKVFIWLGACNLICAGCGEHVEGRLAESGRASGRA